MIKEYEINLARKCISFATEAGAEAARVSLGKCVTDAYTLLNGQLDKATHSADRSVYIYLFVDGRYGTFSTNRLEENELHDFILKAVEMVRMLGEDRARTLPSRERTAKDAVTGNELGLFDESYYSFDSDKALNEAYSLSRYEEYMKQEDLPYRIISEECEFSCTADDNYTVDSQGFEGRHKETSFGTFAEITVEGHDGCKYSGYWWQTTHKASQIDFGSISGQALERAVRQIDPQKRKSGRYRMVLENTVSSRVVTPLINALNASAIQQKMSFLEDSIGRQTFSEGLTIMDLPRTCGKNGSRLFDTEGVATEDGPIIRNGVVQKYFVSTYLANKMGIVPTVEDVSRPCLMPYIKGETLSSEEKELSLKDILKLSGNGILVTGFNGGNCNPVTGDFSFGVEGFAFSKGRITHPVREMLITGNMLELWNNLIAAGSDARPSSRWQIPTLAFEDVSFSA